MAAQEQAADGKPRRQHLGVIGGLALAALDAGVYLALTLAARHTGCIAPQVTTPVLDCFWNNLGASLYQLPWVYVAISLVVPFAVGLLVATCGGAIERGAMAGGVAGLCGSGVEVLLIAGIIAYGYIVASLVPGGSGCGSQSRCVDLTRIPGMLPLLLIVLGTIIIGVVLFRALAGLAAGALGDWLGQLMPHPRRALTRPAHL